MTPARGSRLHYVIYVAAALAVGTCGLQAAFAATAGDDASARASWRAAMTHRTNPEAGCFQASYPSVLWEKVECKAGDPGFHLTPRHPTADGAAVTGDGNDYVAQSGGLITEAVGSFPSLSGVDREKGVGVPGFGDGGILGPNEYTLQLNTNYTGPTAACAGHGGCLVWQQFAYGSVFPYPHQTPRFDGVVFIEYWLLGWGASSCPRGWLGDGGGDCYRNSSYLQAPNVPVSALGSVTLSGSAVAGGNDSVVFNDGTTAYAVTAPDSVVDIASVWTESEFNVFGNGDGSEAVFNKGSSITVNVALTDGSSAAPACLAGAGTTGESNNLNLGACTAAGGTSPSIQFTESN
jgi:hypothetical protein